MIELEEFKFVFSGLEWAYGQWSKANKAKTLRKAPSDIQWESHLNGTCGLGIVPIQKNGKCRFGAIDIDQDSIDLVVLSKKIKEKGFPLICCRSKSGGAHLYHFADPVISAVALRKKLSDWAGKLGFGKSEIFPKQEKLVDGEVGNWINLPYFNAEDTDRYAVVNSKKLSLKEFLNEVKILISSVEVEEEKMLPSFSGMPPCLTSLIETGIPKGHRNEAMYNYTVYMRKSAPEAWEDNIHQLNHEIFKPPLSTKEVNSIIKSVDKKDYGYKCKTAPIDMFCNRIDCLTKEFGVKNVTDTYNDIMVGSVTKVLTDPPRWILEVNGVDIILTTEEMMNYLKVRILCLEKIDMVVPPMKPEEWLKVLKDRLTTKTVITAPEDTGVSGPIMAALTEFLSMYDRAKNKEDIIRGIPVPYNIEGKAIICFRSHDFMSFMMMKKMPSVPGPNLWMMLRGYGCGHTKIKFGGKAMQVWTAPVTDEGKIILIPIDEEVEL